MKTSGACLSLFKGLLQDVVDVFIDFVQLLLLDVALGQQALSVLLVGVLVCTDCLHTNTCCLGT